MSAPADPRPIGVFDSGVGGLTVFKALEAALPHERMIYLGDTARVPYGTRSRETVVRYALEAERFLARHDVKMMVVACNTASSVAIDELRAATDVPVHGVIGPGARRAIQLSQGRRIGVIGTRATIASEAYPQAIRALAPAAHVVSRACPLFVPLAEEGWTDNEVTRKVGETYLAELRAERIDTLVLGCTHYPLLRDAIAHVMGDDVRIVDSAESVAAEIVEHLEQHEVEPGNVDRGEPGGGRDRHEFFVTDVPAPFHAVAERFLGHSIERLQQADITGD
jgi:glutamate racemase